MLGVSNAFKTAMKQPVKELQAYLTFEDIDIRDDNDLISFKISCDTNMCKTAMRKLEAKYLGEHNLLNKWVHVGFGVKLSTGSFEYLDYGLFLITEISFIKDTGITTIIGYDKMISSMKEYSKLETTYPINLYEYTKKLCKACDLELGNLSFPIMGNWSINQELWENIQGITYRDIFVQIAQVTASTCMIGNDNKVYFRPITNTNEELTYDNLMKLKLEPVYGEINSVVLGREPIIGENIFLKDDTSINANGLTEFRIDNNEIVDKDRENAITPIYNALHGIKYYPFEVTTEGLGWYEIADNFNIVNDEGEVFNTSLFNFSITIDGAIKEILKTTANTKTQSQYQYASNIDKRVKNTEILVNKQEQYIEQLVTDVYEEDGIVHENFTKVYQDIDNIINTVQNSSGNNFIKNSVMFAYDGNNVPSNWNISGDGSIIINSSAESMTAGGISGHTFTLLNKKASQRVYVKQDSSNIPEEEKTYYTFCTKIKKLVTGTCYVKLYNSNETHLIQLNTGQSSFYQEYEIKGLLPKNNYYDIEFYASTDSEATFTDNMLSVGKYKSQWTQAQGEIMNTQVNINLDGVLVKSSVYLGDYTIMSPLEFAGYSNINGTITKVFTVNKDTTQVKKLKADDEITMTPIKIVPIKTGDLQGWAFVPTS